jgi:hypothetical protein
MRTNEVENFEPKWCKVGDPALCFKNKTARIGIAENVQTGTKSSSIGYRNMHKRFNSLFVIFMVITFAGIWR